MEEEVGVKHDIAEPFGDENSSKEEVYAFYKDWGSFSTIKQFTYVDLYNPKDAPNRRIKRLIENDNRKERNKERRKFDEKIRDLLAYVKREDPRYARYQEEDLKIKQAKREEAERKKKAQQKADAERLKRYREELAEHHKQEEQEALERGDYDEVVVEEFECKICRKTFKKEG